MILRKSVPLLIYRGVASFNVRTELKLHRRINYGFFHVISGRNMTTAYSGVPGDGTKCLDKISYIPILTELKNGRRVEVTPFKREEWSTGMELMNLIIREGKSWPFVNEFETEEAYRGYFLSDAAFVIRATEDGFDNTGSISKTGEILGCFYIKPNFPGRCSHICNGGFITTPKFRQMGVGTVMGKCFLKLAKDLGYKSSYFNLVFKSNTASVRLWESLGFKRVATLEKAAELIGVDGLDDAYGYRYDLKKLPSDFPI
jgi:RimJ/RimL family protein N-acetyltransferase